MCAVIILLKTNFHHLSFITLEYFFDREQSSKVLKEALLLFLFAWNQVLKMVQIEQKLCKGRKIVLENKKCAREQKQLQYKALLTCNLCFFSRPTDGVTNQIVFETTTKHCKSREKILHKNVFDLKLPIILPLSVF